MRNTPKSHSILFWRQEAIAIASVPVAADATVVVVVVAAVVVVVVVGSVVVIVDRADQSSEETSRPETSRVWRAQDEAVTNNGAQVAAPFAMIMEIQQKAVDWQRF